jgi:hypothetical protein
VRHVTTPRSEPTAPHGLRPTRILPLRQRPELRTFFAQQFESEWPKWYGPGGPGDAHKDLEAFANPEGNAQRLGFDTVHCATTSAVSLLEREGWSQIDAIVHDDERLIIFARAPGAA